MQNDQRVLFRIALALNVLMVLIIIYLGVFPIK